MKLITLSNRLYEIQRQDFLIMEEWVVNVQVWNLESIDNIPYFGVAFGFVTVYANHIATFFKNFNSIK